MRAPSASPSLRLAAALLAAGASALAQAQQAPDGRWSMSVGLNRLQPQPDERLREPRSEWGMNAGIEWRYSPFVALQLDLVAAGQSADMPAVERSGRGAPGARRRQNVNLDGVAGGLRLVYPVGRLAPYAGAGAGVYSATISDYPVLAGLVVPGEFAKRRDSALGVHAFLGVEYLLSQTSALRFEYRWLQLEANFGPELGGPVRIGGGLPSVAYRRGF